MAKNKYAQDPYMWAEPKKNGGAGLSPSAISNATNGASNKVNTAYSAYPEEEEVTIAGLSGNATNYGNAGYIPASTGTYGGSGGKIPSASAYDPKLAKAKVGNLLNEQMAYYEALNQKIPSSSQTPTNETTPTNYQTTTPTSKAKNIGNVPNRSSGTGSTGGAPAGSGGSIGTGGSTPSAGTVPALNPVSDAAYQQALATLQQVQKSAPVYANSYEGQLADLYQQIVGRDPFRYDLNGDMLYQQYAQQYKNNGRLAMQDTMGQAAALTGGYGSTYGQQVGQQQYDAYLQKLNDVVPDLYNQAYNEWLNQGDRLQQQYSMLGDMADDEYSKYLDSYDQWLKERDYAGEVADTEYAKYQKALADYEAQQAALAAGSGSGSSGGGGRVGYDTHGYTTDQIKELQKAAGLEQTGKWGEKEKQAYKAGYRANGDTGNGTSAPASGGTLPVSPQVKTYSEALAYLKSNGVDGTNDLMTSDMWNRRKNSKDSTPEISLFNNYSDYLNNMVDYLQNEKYKK